ncbi:MAG: winged helix-turn-helix transcriptional regulator [Promethearchaeota archaeon]
MKEYKNLLIKKAIPSYSNSYLIINNIFENKYRRKIIDKVLEEPGIHNNELIRQCNIQNGQLKWHLNVLLRYNIIKQVKIGQYNTFYPILSFNQNSKVGMAFLSKSKTTLIILNIIEKNPGINSSAIARQLNLARSTLKYHIDKLSRKHLISIQANGNKKSLYPNLTNN